ncbi:MAG: hypothetical protein EAZ32_13180 [Cytophagia bacterium]|nr:MAG: hypothetical protein EAZ38_14290 [Cytophagales bacterium]TAG38188.1 MAG: hypothetical protein EAZ32_13180 [Cytophagia bacterium]TAG51351.1 MAG: hypothetical protein EAZ29_09910 [Runella slithyformis]
MIFQTDQTIGTYTYDGTTWQPSNARTAAAQVAGAWDKQGNAIDATDFLGSTNNFPLVFKVNGVNSGLISTGGNTFLGYEAGMTTSTTFSTGFGWNALKSSSGNGNTAFGAGALANVSSNANTAFGLNALRGASGTVTGSTNTAFGGSALFKNTSGSNNVALGQEALYENLGGSYNFGLGSFALYANTSGDNNIAIGGNSINKNTNGSYNIGIGNNTLTRITNTSSSNNIAIGQDALAFLVSGSNNTAIGYNAGFNNTGSSNVFIGHQSGYNGGQSNSLFISNNNTSNPLIRGDFSTGSLKINVKPQVGSVTNLGSLAIGDFDASTSPQMATPVGYRLIVQDGILTEKLKVSLRTDAMNWADYVFDPSYKLMPLEEVEKFTKMNKHLPNVPSADEITKEGIDVAKVSKMFMEKIEELTLHIIELNKRIKELENKK